MQGSEKKQQQPRDPIEHIMSDPWFRPTTQNVAWWIWHKGGHQVHERVTNLLDIERVTGRDRRTVSKCVEQLRDAQIMHIVEWDEHSGAIHYQMYFPSRDRGARPRDPQLSLPFITADFQSDIMLALSGPGPDSTPSAAADSTLSGSLPDSTPSDRGDLSRAAAADVTPSGPGSDSTPSALSADSSSSGSPPDAAATSFGGARPDDAFARGSPAGCAVLRKPCASLAQKRPANRSNESKERKSFQLPPKVQSSTSARMDTSGAAGTTCASLAQKRPAAIGDALPDALAHIATPLSPEARRTWKVRLVLQIAAVAGEENDWWVAGAGADLVVQHGYHLKDLDELLGQLSRRKRLPPDSPAHIANPGGWLQHRLHQVADKLDVNWGKARPR